MKRNGTIHVIGAGLAGLSTAVHLTAAGRKVILHEAGTHAGGRCRSYFDNELGVRIDNGNHLMLACNEAALGYLDLIGAFGTLEIFPKADFTFADIDSNARWTLSINDGRFPKWIFDPKARVPETKWWDYLAIEKLKSASRWTRVTEVIDKSTALYRNFLAPMCISIMNTVPQEASARMLGAVFNEAFSAGGQGCRPMMAREGLSESFIDPAITFLEKRGAEVRFGKRLRGLQIENDEVNRLHFVDDDISFDPLDWVVLAVPAWVINGILPSVPTPTEFRSIVNAHFKVGRAQKAPAILGVVGGLVEWVFEKGDILSTTTSAAARIVDKSAEELAQLLWRDVAQLYGFDAGTLPPYRIVKEKRATFAATPDQIIRRPKIETRHQNLVLCGDWTNTKLPSTIEGSIRSGRIAAACIIPSYEI
jgi:squalene-associated FAD-dependent desaturase